MLGCFIRLVLEAGAADEFAHDGGRGNLLVADGQEEAQELQQTMGLGVFLTVLGHRGEDELCMGPQHGKFDVQGRVEHHVGRLLEGEYPLVFGLAHVFPLGDGLLGGIGAFIVVADDSPEQAVVAHGNPVVVVERDAGEGGDVDLVLQRVVDLLREQRVQGVDAFDD